MRVAAIYDIHGNLPALDAVLREIGGQGVDRIVVGGDVVPGPMPRETLARLLSLDIPVQFISGNGEAAVLAVMTGQGTDAIPEQAREAVQWTAQQFRSREQKELASWPATLRLELPDLGPVFFCHATPRSNTEIFTRLTAEDELRPIFEDVDAALAICGHTHMQFDRRVGKLRIVNAGSVGMPFGLPGAYWLLLGPDVQLRRTSYDLAAAADIIRYTRYPQAHDFATRNVLQPPSEEDMLRVFSPRDVPSSHSFGE